ncbi:MAG: hypothetical protein EOP66_11430, partial [Sphingomonas sp.]
MPLRFPIAAGLSSYMDAVQPRQGRWTMKLFRQRLFVLGIAALMAPSAGWTRDLLPLSASSAGIETIKATVDGQEGTYLFDSGIGTSGVTPAVAAAIGCKPWGKITGFRATGERLDVPRCNSSTVKIGAFATTLPQLSVFDLARFMGPASAGLAGAIGLDVFVGRTVTLDVANHQLAIEDAASLKAIRKTAVEVPIRLVRVAEGAALTVDIGVPTLSGMAWMELDTGNYGPSMVDRSIARVFGLNVAETKLQQWTVPLSDRLKLSGPVVVKDLILDGNLGRDVLRR